MLRSGVRHVPKTPATAAAMANKKTASVHRKGTPPKTSTTATRAAPLLPYPIRRASAYEMLYGGARVQHLVQPAFHLHKIHSENLPSPSLEAERHDLALEMQLPRDLSPYNNISMHIQRQVGADGDAPDAAAADRHHKEGFDMGAFYADQHHPDRHHNSSLPYSQHDTNNVLGLRLFPVNIGIRARTEAVRIRTEDCLRRLRDAKLCAEVHQPLEYPLPLAQRSHYGAAASTLAARTADAASRTAHLRGAAAHPSPAQLSILTRPVDRTNSHSSFENNSSSSSSGSSNRNSGRGYVFSGTRRFPVHPFAAAAVAATTTNGTAAMAWKPLQMLKPMGHSWSAATRSSGVRGPHMQLMQERLDQKGFGWKRKSRSLWQQDVATAGFRPHRYF